MSCTAEELRGICLFPSGGVQEFPTEDCDEVHPGILLGNAASAADIAVLKQKGVGAVLNAAFGDDASLNMIQILPEAEYTESGISFLGIPAVDMMSYPLHSHFAHAIEFLKESLQEKSVKVLVHCKQGISRSAALVIAYLVKEEGMTLQDAVRSVREKREILPNDGFLLQLCQFCEEEKSYQPS